MRLIPHTTAIGAAFVSHYQRNPLQLIGLILIVAVATALWISLHLLTSQARDSFAQSEAALKPTVEIQRKDEQPITREDFGLLRQAGLCVTPRLTITLPVEPPLTLLGVDPLSATCVETNAAPGATTISLSDLLEPKLWGNRGALEHWRQSDYATADVLLQPEPATPAQTLVGDIGVVARFVYAGTARLQLLTRQSDSTTAQDARPRTLPDDYQPVLTDYGVESDELAESFLFNLDALALLVLLVAALLVRSVYIFGLSQRQQTLIILERAGVTRRAIITCLAIELAVIGTAGATLGMFIGSRLAGIFSQGLRSTLAGLFDADPADFTLPGPELWLVAVLLILGVMVWACGDLFWRRQQPMAVARSLLLRALAWPLGALLAGSTLIGWANTLCQLYAGIALVLSALAMVLPRVIVALLHLFEVSARGSLWEWSWSEMQALTRDLAVPLIALAFAMAAAVGVHSMVTSFETTFSAWLDQRLQGDFFLSPTESGGSLDDQRKVWNEALGALPEITQAYSRVSGRGLAAGTPVDVLVVDAHSSELINWPFITHDLEPWRRLAAGDSVFVNEQLARREGLSIGDRLALSVGQTNLEPRIAAIYPDYGRPAGEVLLNFEQLGPGPIRLPDQSLGYSLTVSDPRSFAGAIEKTQLPGTYSLRAQQDVRQLAKEAFARTFRLTEALISLTLLLSGLGLALIGIATFRIRQPLYALVHVFGLTRGQVRGRLLAHAAGLAFLLATLAVPIGVFLSWLLVARVNPLAFGWSLPFNIYPVFWLGLVAGAVLIGVCVGWVMGWVMDKALRRGQSLMIFALPLFLALSGCDKTDTGENQNGFASLGSPSEQYLQPHSGMTLSLPDDMGEHPDFRLEWWYVTANLKAEDGRKFGAQWTLFRQSLRPAADTQAKNPASKWDSPAIWMAHAALSSRQEHVFAEKLARGGTPQAGAETEPVRLWLDDWQLRESSPGTFELTAEEARFSYRLTMRRTRPVVLHGINGFSAKSPGGQGSMYFSFVGLEVSGQIRLGDETINVAGTAWLDREWGSQLIGRSQDGWDWFSMHLADDSKLMVFQLRGEPVFPSGTLIQPNGNVVALRPEQIRLQPLKTTSTEAGNVPTQWRIQIPDYAVEVTASSWPGEYWNLGLVPYWEGPISVIGSHTGEGFLEMTGYPTRKDD